MQDPKYKFFPYSFNDCIKRERRKIKEVHGKTCNLSINILLLNTIQETLGYTKLMKKLTSKKKLVEGDTCEMTHVCSAIMNMTVTKKKNNPRVFTIPCIIGMHEFAKALCDFGSRINLMPFVIYKKLRLDTPKPTSMRPIVVDRSIKKPMRILFYVLVKEDKFILLMDFVVLDC